MVEPTYSENCSLYEGICSAHLKHLQTANNSLTVVVNSGITEQQLSTFFNALEGSSDLISDECSVAIIPFICQYIYPPCDGSGNAKFITQEQCINIRDEVCISEWTLAMATRLGSLLPICEAIDADNNNISQIKEESNISEPLKCHNQFREFCGVCLPLCGNFSQYTAEARISEDIASYNHFKCFSNHWWDDCVCCCSNKKERNVCLIFSYIATPYIHTYCSYMSL